MIIQQLLTRISAAKVTDLVKYLNHFRVLGKTSKDIFAYVLVKFNHFIMLSRVASLHKSFKLIKVFVYYEIVTKLKLLTFVRLEKVLRKGLQK